MAAPALKFGFLPPDPEAEAATPVPPLRSEADLDEAIVDGGAAELNGRALTQRALRSSLAFFASEVIRGDVSSRGDSSSPAAGQTVIADHQEEWDQIVRTQRKFCIIAPRDHGKSHIFTIALPIWEGWRRPGCVIALFSETQPQAEEQLSKLKKEIETNPRLQHLMDASCWSATKIRFSNGSTIYARGFGVKARGMHPHLIICDDVVSEAAMYSDLVRERQANYFFGAIRNMLVPGGQLAVIGTPQHLEDLYGRLEKNPEWFFKRYAAIDTDKASPTYGKVLFPERYNEDLLNERRREIGEIRFAREFLGRPVSSGMSIFPDDLVRNSDVLQPLLPFGPYLSDGAPARPWWVASGVTRFYAGVDIATSTNVGGDYFVIFVIGMDDFGRRYVVDIVREHGLGFKEQKALITDRCRLWRTEMAIIESNIAQKIYSNEIREDTDIPVTPHQTGAEKHTLERGIPSLRVLFENRKYRVPRSSDDIIIATDIWLGELQAWTFANGKVVSVARHDDTAMAQWLCEIAVQRGEAFSFAFGEQEGDAEAAAELAQEEIALAGGGAATPGATDDPWVLMGLEPEDMAAAQGRRGNLDFGAGDRHHSPVTPPTKAPNPQQPTTRPAHPLGNKVPLWGIFNAGRGAWS